MPNQISGTQVVGRVARLLKIVGERAPEGISALDVAARSGLTRPTVHRLLASLTREGFVDHDARSARWFLGPEVYLLGALAAQRYDISELALDSVRLLARETGESAFLSARRGDETVCLIREDGSFPIRSFVLHEGVRFPLGIASAGLAILSYLPDAEIDRYLDGVASDERFAGDHAPDGIRERIAATREVGYALNPGLVVEGSWGMGAAVFDAAGHPAWALSITGIESRFKAERRPELGRLLLAQAHRVTLKLRDTKARR